VVPYEYATDGADFLPIAIRGGGHGIEVTEQFICPVNQMRVHLVLCATTLAKPTP
jgi:hypothetical protein